MLLPIFAFKESNKPQLWHFFAPRCRQRVQLGPPHINPPHPQQSLFCGMRSWNAWHLLARPDPGFNGSDSQGPPIPDPLLLQMPTELFLHILAMLTAQEMLALAFTSRAMFMAILAVIDGELVKGGAPWAGHEIACLGSSLTDLPEPLLKSGLAYLSVGMQSDRMDGESGPNSASRMEGWARLEYAVPSNSKMHTWRAALEEGEKAGWVPTLVEKELGTLLAGKYLYPDTEPWFLRNLDARQFVRCRPGKDLRGHIEVDEELDFPFSVEDALLLNICWSARLSNDSGDLKKGAWAGHRFDIVTERRNRAEQVSGGPSQWTDVTDQILLQAKDARASIKRRTLHLRNQRIGLLSVLHHFSDWGMVYARRIRDRIAA